MELIKLKINNRRTQKKLIHYIFIFNILISLLPGCKKDATVSADALYIPTAIDVTSNATLQELQQGRELYIDNCSRCHGLYLPENYSPAQWKITMNSMGPKTGLSSSDQSLITKYLCKGKQ